MKIFIHHDGALGDTLLSVPCFRALRKEAAFLHLAAGRDVGILLKRAGIVDAVTPSGDARFSSLYARPHPELVHFLTAFDQVLVFATTENSPTFIGLRRLVPNTRLIRTIPPQDSRSHAASYRLSQISADAVIPVKLTLSADDDGAVTAYLSKAGFGTGRKLLAVHPGSGGKSKCWLLARYLDVVDLLQQRSDISVLIFTGLAEEGEMKKRINSYASTNRNVAHAEDRDLCTAAALLSRSDLYIGNDSGFTHLAAATAKAAITLFGPTDPAVWKPIGSQVHVISSEQSCSLDVISVERVFEKAVDLLY